ncbi:Carbohydrate/purine kinase [Pleurostoma richardsiae]|uniref:Carbohydrate/purine kinase n=1 Tax=Pleurostoma richardsiae TaxID=41990 RepID=A0AA38S7H9_9PEZI|nr:Carbohydrate/purine kinase [Pleurostoma richardsiae]
MAAPAGTTNEQPPRPAFVSLGMVVLDELRAPGRSPLYDVLGGSGAFSVLGARLAAGRARAGEVGCFILAGNDFPDGAVDRFRSWGVNLVIKVDPTRRSTRGLLEYKDSVFSSKTFRYTTTPLRPSPKDLPSHFLAAGAFHLLASPSEVEAQVTQLLSLRSDTSIVGDPLLIWEPAPLSCNRDAKEEHLAAAKLVDVFSPNHLELLALFQDITQGEQASPFHTRLIEACADAFLDSGVGPSGAGTVVIRAGGHGCLVASTAIKGRHQWLPPFYGDASAIVDATGAGNTFLGALTFAMGACGKDALEGAAMANVAASFVVEQIGCPELRQVQGGEECWNNSAFLESDDPDLFLQVLGPEESTDEN